MAHGALTPIIGLRLLALAAGLRHNAEIGQPGLCFSAYGHKFGINHLGAWVRNGDCCDRGEAVGGDGGERTPEARGEGVPGCGEGCEAARGPWWRVRGR